MPFWVCAAVSGWLVAAGVAGALCGTDRTQRALSAMLVWNGAILLLVTGGAHLSPEGRILTLAITMLWPFVGGLFLAMRR